jgi:hypothetical protein
VTKTEVLVQFHRRAHLPILIASGLLNKPVKVPWWNHVATCSPRSGPTGMSESARLPAGRTPPCGASASRRSRSSGS